MNVRQLLPGLWQIEDRCNVYLVADGGRAIAVDCGSADWLALLPELGLQSLDHVFLTHAHEDQCAGLSRLDRSQTVVHAPAGEQAVLDPGRDPGVLPPWYGRGCPANYTPPRRPEPDVRYDLAGNGHSFWQGRRLRFIHTPGHGFHACSLLLDHEGRQVLFCGDAAHAGATIPEPFHLEWDHWTGAGALAAWEGIERLRGIDISLLCPSHGPVINEGIHELLGTLSDRLLDFYRAKGQISPQEPDRYLTLADGPAGTRRVSEHLYTYGNGYLLASDSGAGLVVDPTSGELPALEALLAELGVRPTASVVSHYHYDHADAIPYLREKYGTEAWLHPAIAEALAQEQRGGYLPWLLPTPIRADHLWPERGQWQWEEYTFEVAHWPGQTWWHCAFMTHVDGRHVLFAGDSFTPTSKWNGTGGFCAYNNSRFEGYRESVEVALAWQPEIMAAGHHNTYGFSESKFRKIADWADRAEAVTRALCPSGDLEQDYYSVHRVIREL